MENWALQYKVDIPEGTVGSYSIEKFTVSEREEILGRLQSAISFSSLGRYVPAGTYTRLTHTIENDLLSFQVLVMTDTPDEVQDHWEPIYNAKGHCLVNGLGLGVVVNGMLMNKKVSRVTVIEIAPEVIELVAPHYQKKYGDRIEVIEADALTWTPPKGVRYDIVWHDIWTHICEDNLPEMKALHRKYGRRCDWQGSWAREKCERGYYS